MTQNKEILFPTLWNKNSEIEFFKTALDSFASVEKLFYILKDGIYAYIPKGVDSEGLTLQSRNSLIGNYTEKWCKDILSPIARENRLFAVNSVQCDDIALTRQSAADLAFCTTNSQIQKVENIKMIFEIKMSIVNNYKYFNNHIEFIGDYKSHQGNPSLLRSDSMLKAIGKAINIRVSSYESTKIPIVVIGNSPITDSYINKVDHLKSNGVIQNFISLNPNPISSKHISKTPKGGFLTPNCYEELKTIITRLINSDMQYVSFMIRKTKLAEIIRQSCNEPTDTLRAEKFISLIQQHLS